MRWCVKVHQGLYGVIEELDSKGYLFLGTPYLRSGAYWLYFAGKKVRACESMETNNDDTKTPYFGENKPLMGDYKELHPADIFDLPPFEANVELREPFEAECDHEWQVMSQNWAFCGKCATRARRDEVDAKDPCGIDALNAELAKFEAPSKPSSNPCQLEPLPERFDLSWGKIGVDVWHKINEIIGEVLSLRAELEKLNEVS